MGSDGVEVEDEGTARLLVEGLVVWDKGTAVLVTTVVGGGVLKLLNEGTKELNRPNAPLVIDDALLTGVKAEVVSDDDEFGDDSGLEELFDCAGLVFVG